MPDNHQSNTLPGNGPQPTQAPQGGRSALGVPDIKKGRDGDKTVKPYYDRNGITIYCGDCREILPGMAGLETIIADPVWPNTAVKMNGHEDPFALFAEMCQAIPADTARLVVQLGCDSDPRFLNGVPAHWNFLRYCWLDYAKPSYKGRLLYTGDVAFVFGVPPAFINGRQVMSGMCRSTKSDSFNLRGTGEKVHKSYNADIYDQLAHPCARRLQHVQWLIWQFSDNAVCDPFMGSGTTAVAAKYHNRRFIGIEIEEIYCELAVKRLAQEVMTL